MADGCQMCAGVCSGGEGWQGGWLGDEMDRQGGKMGKKKGKRGGFVAWLGEGVTRSGMVWYHTVPLQVGRS